MENKYSPGKHIHNYQYSPVNSEVTSVQKDWQPRYQKGR